MIFLEDHSLQSRCVTLHTPGDLNDPGKVQALFDKLGLQLIDSPVRLRGRKNKSLGGTTIITEQDEAESEAVLRRLPARFLDIFHREPYLNFGWSARLRRRAPVVQSAASTEPRVQAML